MNDAPARPGERPTIIDMLMPDASTVTLSPWPFDRDQIRLNTPARRLGKRRFASDEEFRGAYHAAAPEFLQLIVRRP